MELQNSRNGRLAHRGLSRVDLHQPVARQLRNVGLFLPYLQNIVEIPAPKSQYMRQYAIYHVLTLW